MNILKGFFRPPAQNERVENREEVKEGIISRLVSPLFSLYAVDDFLDANEEELENEGVVRVFRAEPEQKSGRIAQLVNGTFNGVETVGRKLGAAGEFIAGYGLDAAFFGIGAAYYAGNYTVKTANKFLGTEEEYLGCAQQGVEKQLKRATDNYGSEGAKFLDELGDFITHFAIKFAPEKGLIAQGLNFVGLDYINNSVKSNVLNALTNLLDKSDFGKEIDYEENIYAGISDLYVDKTNPLRHFKNALENIFLPFATEYHLKESLIRDAAYEVQKRQAKVSAFDTITLNLAQSLKNQSNNLLNRQKIIARFASATLDELQNAKEAREILKSSIKEELRELKTLKLTLSKPDRDQNISDIKDAKDALIQCDYELEAIEALINRDVSKLTKFKQEADLIQVQLEVVTILELKNEKELEKAKIQALFDLEKVQERLHQANAARKNFMVDKVAPKYLDALFPQGSASLLIYQKYLAVSPIQEVSWFYIEDLFLTYFDQFFPLLLQIDLPQQEALFAHHPHSETIKQALDYGSEDVLNLIFDCFNIPQILRSNLKDWLSPYIKYVGIKYVNQSTQIDRDSFVNLMSLISEIQPLSPPKQELQNPEIALRKEFEASHPEKDVEEYIKALKLPAKNNVKRENALLGKALRELYKQKNSVEAQTTVTEILKLLQLDNLEILGVPPLLAKFGHAFLIKKLGSLINEYLFEKHLDLKEIECTHLPTDKIGGTTLKVNTLQQALTSIIHAQLNKHLDMRVKTANGSPKIVNILAKCLGKEASKFEEKYAILGFLGSLLSDEDLNPLIESTLNLADSNRNLVDPGSAEIANSAKISFVQLFMPLLINMTVKAFDPVLKKEKQGGAIFNQTLLLRVLPFVTEHLKNLNMPSLNPLKGQLVNSQAIKDASYRKISTQLLDFFLPEKIESLRELFPRLSDKELEISWNLLISELPGLLAQLTDAIFDKSVLRDILIELYKICIQTFETPSTDKNPSEFTPSSAELALQAQMKEELKGLMYQAALITDLPVDKFLKIASYLPGNQKILDAFLKATCTAIQKQFNGKLIVDNLDKGLKSQINKPEGDPTIVVDKNAELDQLERKLVESAFTYAVRGVKEKVDASLKKLDYPVIKQIKNVILAIADLIIFKIIGRILTKLGLKAKLINKSHEILHRNRVEISNKFAQPKKHENLLFEIAQAGVNVLECNWEEEAGSLD